MKITIDRDLKNICKQIHNLKKTKIEWEEMESSDMFQSAHYEGGYEADEEAFCFSYYDFQSTEWWLQITLQDINEIILGKKTCIKLTSPSAPPP